MELEPFLKRGPQMCDFNSNEILILCQIFYPIENLDLCQACPYLPPDFDLFLRIKLRPAKHVITI